MNRRGFLSLLCLCAAAAATKLLADTDGGSSNFQSKQEAFTHITTNANTVQSVSGVVFYRYDNGICTEIGRAKHNNA